MRPAFILLVAVYLLGTAFQHILMRAGLLTGGALKAWAVLIGCAAFLLAALSGFKPTWRKFLASNRFSVPVLIVLTVLSIGGTLILQSQPEAVLLRAYGSALEYIRMFFLDDIFHSFGFTSLMGLGAGGLFLVITRKRRLNTRYLGSLGAHLGLLLVLAGAAIGNVWGVKGQLNLKAGNSSDHFFVPTGAGKMAKHPLGYTLRLDEFRLLHYEKAYRLALFDVSGKREEIIVSVDPGAQERKSLSEHGIEVLDYWPDHFTETIVKPKQGEATEKLAALGLTLADRPEEIVWIFDDDGDYRIGNKRLVLFWAAEQAEAYLKSLGAPSKTSPHIFVIEGKEITAEVGKAYPLPDGQHRIEIARALEDFVLDPKSRTPQNRSEKPNNPAVEVLARDAAGNQVAREWLFAKFPDFHGKKTPMLSQVLYRYAGSPVRAADLIAVGGARELWNVSGGKVESRQELAPDKAIRIGEQSATVRDLHESAERSFRDRTRSPEANNPLVRLRIGDKEAWVAFKRPVHLPGKKALALIPKGGDPVRDYLSVVSVYQQDRKVLTRTIEVNHPLVHQGFAIYQSDYRPDDPTFSGFQVVSDPGLWIVYLGFVVNFLGVICVVFLTPILRRKKASEAA